VSLKVLPPRVRSYVYLFWAGAVAAGSGIAGFFFSFGRVGSPAQATIDVHSDIPVLAYASIAAWVVGLAVMWYCRRQLNTAVAKRQRERHATFVGTGEETDGTL